MCLSFPFGFEGGMWDLIVLIPDLAFLFTLDVVCGYVLLFLLYIKIENR